MGPARHGQAMENLVSARWLSDNLMRDDLVVIDCSVSATKTDGGPVHYQSGQPEFARGHIPSARHVDLVTDLTDRGSAHLFALPSPEAFRCAMAALGISDTSTVVLYDRSFTAWAARVWWMLRWIGFDKAVILNGGLGAWTAAGFDLSVQQPVIEQGRLSLNTRTNMIATQDTVRKAQDTKAARLLDTLSAEAFDGTTCDYARPGHITGATHAFTLDLFNADGTFRTPEQLAELLEGDRTIPQITYCGAGILASATAFVLVQLGYPDVAVYMASLQEWAADPANPMHTGIDGQA